jgi:anaerobic selenocysteine-containing dehydrogenase
MTAHVTMCQACHNGCPLEVEVIEGVATSIRGNPRNSRYAGFSCVKGREQLKHYYSPDRLLRSQKRRADGTLTPIDAEDALDEIAVKVQQLIAEHGPRSVAVYTGTQALQDGSASLPVIRAFWKSIDSPMVFDSASIDQPGRGVAPALQGTWRAGKYTQDEADVVVLFGANPLVSMLGFPLGNHGRWLNGKLESGTRLIVVDPRRSETARRASLFLQPRPGHDTEILAAMIWTVLHEKLFDAEFAADHLEGVDELSRTIAPFTPDVVAERAGVNADDLRNAARVYASAERGFIHAGTGAHMGQNGTLLEYLLLNLTALCGDRRRAGDLVNDPKTTFAEAPAIAQASAPTPARGLGEQLRVRNLGQTGGGLPTSGLAEEILLDGPGQVRALFVVGGNPVAAWPDQLKTIEAMESLELLVQVDPFMSQTAQYADYVIAPRITLEKPHASFFLDELITVGIGTSQGYAHYAPRVLDDPAESDLISEWEVFYELARRLNLALDVPLPFQEVDPVPMDMEKKPTDEDILDLVSTNSRVPLDMVRQHPDGFEGEPAEAQPPVVVQEGDPLNEARLALASPEMMAELTELASWLDAPPSGRMSLISRREMHVANSSYNAMIVRGGRRHNPAFMHPEDMTRIGVTDDDVVRIRSDRASIVAIVMTDAALRPGTVSMAHAFGPASTGDPDPTVYGSSTARLVSVEDNFDRYTGQPRMSGIPVEISRLDGSAAG